jgi:DNA-binding MarR family transcriptional regulator
LDTIIFKKDQKDSRIKHIFLNEKGKILFEEIFTLQKNRIYSALLNSNPEEVLNFDNVLKKIINE